MVDDVYHGSNVTVTGEVPSPFGTTTLSVIRPTSRVQLASKKVCFKGSRKAQIQMAKTKA